MKIVEDDLIKMASEGEFDVIIHGCNCYCQMGKGIALSIKMQFPEAYQADCCTEKLGSFSLAHVSSNDNKFTIINAYTQFHWPSNGVKAGSKPTMMLSKMYLLNSKLSLVVNVLDTH